MVFSFKSRFYLTCLALFVFGSTSCKKERPDPAPKVADTIVIVYMAANNDLAYDAKNSINKMEKAMVRVKNGSLVIFVKTTTEQSFLIRIGRESKSDQILRDTLKTYGSENASDPGFMKRVLTDAELLAPAKSYGLVMWSHATSWAPPSNPRLESFGSDRGVEMDIMDFKQALPENLTYIIFDACSMSSIEVIYELRDCARYILASPSETISYSYPYDLVTPHLFGDVEDLKKVAENFISYYNSLPGLYKSATVSLIDTKELDPLASLFRKLLNTDKPAYDFKKQSIQRFDFDAASRIPAYDCLQFLQMNYVPEKYMAIENQLQKAIIYKAHTASFFGVPIAAYSGITVYLPEINDQYQSYYSNLQWYNNGGFYNLFYK